MNNFSTFVRAGAKFMAADRPDIYTEDSAHRDLVHWYSIMSSHDGPDSFGSGGFILSKRVDGDGDVYWMLSRNIAELSVFISEEDSDVFNWTRGGKLVGTVDLEIPEPDFDDEALDEEPEDLV